MTERSVAPKWRRYMNTLTVFVVIAEKGQHVSGSGTDVKCQIDTENVRGELLCRGSRRRFLLWNTNDPGFA